MKATLIILTAVLIPFNAICIAQAQSDKGEEFITDKVMSGEEKPDYSNIKKQKASTIDNYVVDDDEKSLMTNEPKIAGSGQLSPEEIKNKPKTGKAKGLSDHERMRQLEQAPLTNSDEEIFLLDDQIWIRSKGEYQFHKVETITNAEAHDSARQAKLDELAKTVEYKIVLDLRSIEHKEYVNSLGVSLNPMEKKGYYWVLIPKTKIADISSQGISYAMYPDYPGEIGLEINMPDRKPQTEGLILDTQDIIFSEDFEGNFPEDGDWDVGDDDYRDGEDYWDDVNCFDHSGGWSAWCADIGNMPDCDHYDDRADAYMIKYLDLSGYENVEIEFWLWFETEADFDFFQWWFSQNGSNWYGPVIEYSGSNIGWIQCRLWPSNNVNDYWMKFRFLSDGSIYNYEGVYVDDIVVTGDYVPDPDYAEIYDAWWTNEVDEDGDGYVRSARLIWDPDVTDCNGELFVNEKIYWRRPCGSGSWNFIHETSHHYINDCDWDEYYVDITGGSHNTYDWRIEIYRDGQSSPDDIYDSSDDNDLSCYQMETPGEDEPQPEIITLHDDVYQHGYWDPGYFQYYQSSVYWSVVGIRSPNSADVDIRLYDDSDYSNLLATSQTVDKVDFIVGDYNHNDRPQIDYPKTYYYSGSDPYYVEYENNSDILFDGLNGPFSWSSPDVVEIWDVYLNADEYSFTLDTYGNDDLGMALFKSNGGTYYAGKSSSVAFSDNPGDGDEYFSYFAPTTDWYALVVWMNYNQSATYTIDISILDGIEDNRQQLPSDYSLSQSYPNPFNAQTTFEYALPEASHVTIEIYDMLGRKVETLAQGEQQAGYHQAIWNAENQTSGIYFYRIQAGEYAKTRKMVLLK